MDKLTRSIFYLSSRKVRLGHIAALVQSMEIKIVDKLPYAHAMVTFLKDKKKYRLVINRESFESNDDERNAGIITHEIKHILHGHLGRKVDKADKVWFNVAADMVIDQGNTLLGDTSMSLDRFKDVDGCHPIENRTAEAYMDWLKMDGTTIDLDTGEYDNQGKMIRTTMLVKDWIDMIEREQQKAQQQGEPEEGEEGESDGSPSGGSGGDGGDDNTDTSGFNFDGKDWDGVSEDDARSAQKDLVRNAMKRCGSEGAGKDLTVLKQILDDIEKQDAYLNFKNILKMATKKSVPSSNYTRTYSKPNRRLGYASPGLKLDRKPNVHFLMDTSASMDSKMIEIGFDIAKQLRTKVKKLTFSLFHEYTYWSKVIKSDTQFDVGNIQRSGTILTEPLNRAMKDRADLIIIVTDGEFYKPDVDFKKLPPIAMIIKRGENESHPLIKYSRNFLYEKI